MDWEISLENGDPSTVETDMGITDAASKAMERRAWLSTLPGVACDTRTVKMSPTPKGPWLLPTMAIDTAGMFSLQSGVPLESASVSGEPQPQAPGAVLLESFGQASMQLGVPSESLSVSAVSQPQAPGTVLAALFGQLSPAAAT